MPRADLEVDNDDRAAVLLVMTVTGAARERSAVSDAQHRLAVALDERHFALEEPDGLVLVAVPVPLARPPPWR